MVTVGEVARLIKSKTSGLSNVGVEVLASDGLVGTYLASDIRPGGGEVVVEVYVKDGNSEESDTAFVDGILEVLGEPGISADSRVVVWFVDYGSRKLLKSVCPEAVWENTERDEVTFTVNVVSL